MHPPLRRLKCRAPPSSRNGFLQPPSSRYLPTLSPRFEVASKAACGAALITTIRLRRSRVQRFRLIVHAGGPLLFEAREQFGIVSLTRRLRRTDRTLAFALAPALTRTCDR